MPASPWTFVVLAVAQVAPVADDAGAIRALSDKDPARLRAAIRHLRDRGAAAQAAAVPLIKLLFTTEAVEPPLDHDDRLAAWCALVEVASEPENAPPELVAAVLSACAPGPGVVFAPSPWFRHFLCNCPPKHLAAALAEYRKTAGEQAYAAALVRIAEWGPGGAGAVGHLVGLMKAGRRLGEDEFAPVDPAELIAGFGPAAKDAVGDLEAELRSLERRRRKAALAIHRITGRSDERIIDALLSGLPDPDADFFWEREEVQALAQIGPAVERRLSDCLSHPDAVVRRNALRVLVAFETVRPATADKVFALLNDPDADVRREAVHTLSWSSHQPRGVVAALIRRVAEDADSIVRSIAARTLGGIGAPAAPAVPTLARAVTDDKDAHVRMTAAGALGALGPASAPAVDALMRAAVADSECTVRTEAVLALGSIGDPKAIPALIRALDDRVPKRAARERPVGSFAARMLERFGPAAAPAVPRLIARMPLNLQEWRWDGEEIDALVAIGPVGVAALIRAFDTVGPELRSWILSRLARLDPWPQEVAAFVHRVSIAGPPSERIDALRILARRAAAAAPARAVDVPALVRAMDDPSGDVRAAAAAALAARADVALATLPRRLNDDDPRVRRAACEAIGRFGIGRRDLQPRLTGRLEDPDENVREAAAVAIVAVAPDSPEARLAWNAAVRATGSYELFQSFGPDRHPPTELLVAELRRRFFADGAHDISLIEVLGRIGPKAAAAAPELRRLLRAGGGQSAAIALWRITGDRGPLRQMLTEDWRRCRRWPPYDTGIADVGRMLGEIADAGSLPMLLDGLSGQDADVREAAAIGLGGFGPKASAALPQLRRLVGDPSPAVRRAAAEALRKIETRGNR